MKTKCTKTNRLLSILLCLCMVLSMVPGVPLVAKAAGTEGMITIEMTDSYGDSWNGNAIEIYANGELLDTATIAERVDSGTWTSQIDLHVTYTFKWVLGSYPSETYFGIYVGTENKLSASGSAYSTGDTLLTLERVCAEPTYENGVCTNCGGTCIHEMNDAGICGVCGYECPSHSFINGLCATCGGTCSHPKAIEGKCGLCQQTVNLTIDMTAKYSYGWQNCAEITIFADGTQIGVAKLENSKTGSWSVPFESLVTYTFQWSSLNWPQECSFAIKVGDRTVYSADNNVCDNLQSGVFFTIDTVCSDHTVFGEDGHCLECGLPCRHRFGEDSECDVCGFVCGTDEDHVWNLGVCEVCSLACGHAGWTDFVCDTCGFVCGRDVEHSTGEDLECDVCGFVCGTDGDHTWNKGVCTVCGMACLHEHYEAALCAVCGYYEPAVQNGVGDNGFALYEISNASQLLWFGDYVNSGEILRTHKYDGWDGEEYTYYTTNCVNAKLMADIDMTGLPWVPIGKRDIGNKYYTGVFDGNGHTVSGIDCTATSEDYAYAGFFGESSGTIKNLTVVGNFKAVTTGELTIAYVGGIAAYCHWSRYYLSDGNYETVSSVIENCTFIGTVSGEASNITEVGGIAGYFTSCTMTNCVSAATVTANQCSLPKVGGLVSIADYSTFTSCYYDTTLCSLNASSKGALEGVTGRPTAVFESGAVAYALGFGQTLGTDPYPSYGDDPVYLLTTGCRTYTNTQAEPTEKAHVGTPSCTEQAVCQDCGEGFGEPLGHSEYDADGKCTLCGEYDKPKQNGTGANGFPLYEIENASQLLWFANYVNSGEILKTHEYDGEDGREYTYYTTNCVNAKLMADIDMTGLPWVPIGKRDIDGNYYTGVFDGDGHTVSGIDCTATSEDYVYAGFFGQCSGTVKNLTVVGNFKAVTTGEWTTAYVGGIAAYCHWTHYYLSYGNYETVSSVIENCTFIGTVSGEASNMTEVGGIAGYFTRGTMTNCVSAATVTSNQCSYPKVGGLVSIADYSTFTSCYYDTTLCSLNASSEGTLEGVTGLATADFADGAVAYALGFGQTLGTDAYPTYGDDQVYQVLNCKEETAYSNTNANLDHTWGEAPCLTPRTCSTCGITEAQGHSWTDATCTAPKTCTACGATEGYPDYDNHTEEFTVKFTWDDPYDDQCYVEADLFCSACEQYIASNYAYGVLTQRVEPEDCMHLGTETYEVTLELEGVEYTDVHTFVLYTDNHIGQFENGFCTACGGYEPAAWNEEESLYEISNAGQLYWYAKLLNEQNVEVYAKLTADILIPENAPNWEPINASYAYFNGNFHTISGLKCIGGDRTYVGMFGNEIWWYDISNLHITNSYFEGKEYVGAVAACMSNGGYITNCAVTNTIVKGDGDNVGGLVGYLSSHVSNCFSTATVVDKEGNAPVGYCSTGYGSIENCYFPGTEDEYEGTTAMTAQDFASGKVAYLLQSNISEEDIYDEDGNWIDSYIPEVWGQTIGQDAYPVLKGQKVYQVTNCKDEVAYSNTDNVSGHIEQTVSGYDATCDEPGLTDGVKCSACGETIKAQETIPAPGHDWKDATCDTPKTCGSCGATQGEALGHSPKAGSLKDNGDAHTFTCTNCNNTITEAHRYTDFVCICGVVPSDVVVVLIKNGVPVQGFTTLADAVNAVQSTTAEDEAVLQLRQNIDLGNGYQQIYGGVFTFDLNSFEVSSSNSSWGVLVPENGVNITITDSGEGGKITAPRYGIEAYNSTVTITGGTITSGDCGVTAEDCTVEISGGAISGVSGVCATNGTVTISGGTISGQHYAVYTDFGALTISGGNISGSDCGMFTVDSTVEISGGCITGDINSNNSTIALTVGQNGVGAAFPDGIMVYGTTLNAILGEGAAYWQDSKMILPAEGARKITGGDVVIKAVCTHPVDKTYTNNGDDHTYTYTCCGLSFTETHTFVNGLCICGAHLAVSVTMDGVTTNYTALNSAIQAVQFSTSETTVVKLLKDVDLGDGYQRIYGGVFTFDLNGFEVSSSNPYLGVLDVENGADITITDSGKGGKITAVLHAIEAHNSIVTITGGTISGYSGVYATDSTVTISGGTISAEDYGVVTYGGAVTISGGTISGSDYGMFTVDSTVDISGGTISAQNCGVYTSFGTVTINGGYISGDALSLYAEGSMVEISGGCIAGRSYDIESYDSTIALTVGQNGVGAAFPDGIMVYGTTLNTILGEGAAYWQDGKMILPAEDAWKIIGGDVVIKAVCTHSGDKTYTNNGDDHTYTYTCCGLSFTETHTFVNGLCICSAKENLVADDLKFSSASLTLEDDLTINFKVKQEQLDTYGYSEPYAVFVMGNREVVIRDYIIENGKYVFAFKNVAPYRMNDTVTATLYATKDGVEYASAPVNYGVYTYCYNMLDKFGTDSYAELRTLLVDILNYGAASQLYVNYNTDQLVTAKLTEAQKAWGTANDRQLTSVLDQEYATVANPTVKWTGASLVLKETVAMRFNFKAESVEGLSVKIVESNGTENLISTFTETEDGYYVYFDGLHAMQMSDPVYVTVYEGDTAVSNTVCYSIESYACSKQTDENTSLVDLLKAMIKYGDATKNYVSK